MAWPVFALVAFAATVGLLHSGKDMAGWVELWMHPIWLLCVAAGAKHSRQNGDKNCCCMQQPVQATSQIDGCSRPQQRAIKNESDSGTS